MRSTRCTTKPSVGVGCAERRLVLAFAYAAALALSGPALAQPLDLGSSAPPSLAESRALADLFDAQHAMIEGSDPDPARSPAAFAAHSLRRLALRLIQTDPDTHPERALAGLTIIRSGLPEAVASVDGTSGNGSGEDEARVAILLLMAGDLDRIDPQALSGVTDLDRALRDVLSHPADVFVGALDRDRMLSGWILDPADSPRDAWDELLDILDRLARSERLSASTRDALGIIVDRIENAWGHTGYHASSWRLARTLSLASRSFDRSAVSLTPGAESAARAAFEQAVRSLADPGVVPEAREAAIVRLDRLGSIASVLDAANELAPASLAHGLGTGLSDRMSTLQGIEQLDVGPVGAALELLARAAALPDEREVAREFRPAWRVMRARAERSSRVLGGLVAELVEDPRSMGGLGAMTSLRRELDTLDRMRVFSGRIAQSPGPGREPAVMGRYSRLARTVLTIGQRLDATTADRSAEKDLRELLAGGVLLDPHAPGRSVGEATLPAASPSHRTALTERLRPVLDDAREQWVLAWSDPESSQARSEASDRLTLVGTLHTLILDIERSHSALDPDRSAMNTWPGFELSEDARRALVEGASDRLEQAVDMIAQDASMVDSGRLDALRDRYAGAILVGELERAASKLGLIPRQDPWRVLVELGAGAPDPLRSWLAGSRRDLAEFCLYAEHAGAAARAGGTGDRDSGLAMIEHANRVAKRVLARELAPR